MNALTNGTLKHQLSEHGTSIILFLINLMEFGPLGLFKILSNITGLIAHF